MKTLMKSTSNMQIAKESAFLAKSEADNAKKALTGEKSKAPHWIHHVESFSPSVIRTEKAGPETNKGE